MYTQEILKSSNNLPDFEPSNHCESSVLSHDRHSLGFTYMDLFPQLNSMSCGYVVSASILLPNTDTLGHGVSILFTPTLSTDKSTYLLAQVLLTSVGTMFPILHKLASKMAELTMLISIIRYRLSKVYTSHRHLYCFLPKCRVLAIKVTRDLVSS